MVSSDKISALADKRLSAGGENDPTADFHRRASSSCVERRRFSPDAALFLLLPCLPACHASRQHYVKLDLVTVPPPSLSEELSRKLSPHPPQGIMGLRVSGSHFAGLGGKMGGGATESLTRHCGALTRCCLRCESRHGFAVLRLLPAFAFRAARRFPSSK